MNIHKYFHAWIFLSSSFLVDKKRHDLRCHYGWIAKILIIIFYSWKITVCRHFLWYTRNIQGPKIKACEMHFQSSFQRHLNWPCSVHMPEWPNSQIIGYLTASKNTFHRPEFYQSLFTIFIIDISVQNISTMLTLLICFTGINPLLRDVERASCCNATTGMPQNQNWPDSAKFKLQQALGTELLKYEGN